MKKLTLVVSLVVALFASIGQVGAVSLSDLGIDLNKTDTMRVKVGANSGCVEFKGDRDCLYGDKSSKRSQTRKRAPVMKEADVYSEKDLKKNGNMWEVKVDHDATWVDGLETLEDRINRIPSL